MAMLMIYSPNRQNYEYGDISTETSSDYDIETDESDRTDDIGLFDNDSVAIINDQKSYFDINMVPQYEGNPYVIINDNVPYFSDSDKERTDVFEIYSELDKLGRCGVAYANICIDLLPVEERGEIGPIKPSGWHTVKYNNIIDGNYLYNRCHLIGYQLAGENDNEKNLITGTRYLNIEGMLPFENMVCEYVKSTRNHVLYRVTPVFISDNLVASGVLMEAWSVEDDGKKICFNVYCYNVQPGIVIDYETGDSKEEYAEEVINTQEATESVTVETTENIPVTSIEYVLNTNTHRFHYLYCSSVGEIKEKNRLDYSGSREEVIKMGYKPCKRCNP